MDETMNMNETTKVETTPTLKLERVTIETVTSEALVPAGPIPKTPVPTSLSNEARQAQTRRKQISTPRSRSISEKDLANAHMLRERCRQLYLSVFFHKDAPVRSLGFTSSLSGEGKSFLSAVLARVLADDITSPVTLLECNWEHPDLHERFGIPSAPGFAEWLRGECNETAIRHEVGSDLHVIPAGDGRRDAVKLLQRIQRRGLLNTLARPDELLIVDLPAIAIAGYGVLAASLVEALVVVVRAGVTPDFMLKATSSQLKDFPVQGMILNQVESHVPRWIRQLL
jgi:Mrp family chromosome partitioning ATPase